MAGKAFGYGHELFNGAASGLKGASDMLGSIHNDERGRAQRWREAESQRLSRASKPSIASISHPDYEAWADKVADTINYIYDRAYDNLLNLNLHSFSQLDDATICRVCMQIDTRYRHYISGMFTSFLLPFYSIILSRRTENPDEERDDSGFVIICQECLGNTRGFRRVHIERSLPQPEPRWIRCSTKNCGRVTGDVFLRKLSL